MTPKTDMLPVAVRCFKPREKERHGTYSRFMVAKHGARFVSW